MLLPSRCYMVGLWGVCLSLPLILCSTAPEDREPPPEHPWPLAPWPPNAPVVIRTRPSRRPTPLQKKASPHPPLSIEYMHVLTCGASLEKITYHPNLRASPDLRDINLICHNQSLGGRPHRPDPFAWLGDGRGGCPVSHPAHSLKLI